MKEKPMSKEELAALKERLARRTREEMDDLVSIIKRMKEDKA